MKDNIIIFITILFLSTMFFIVLLQNFWLRIRNIDLTIALFKNQMDHTTQAEFLINKIEELKLNTEKESQEGFVNFLNQSRDWAFDYIDLVQKTIKEFIDVADRKMNYAEKYHDIDPWQEPLVQLIEPYKKIKALLPEEEQKDASKRQA